MIAGGFPAYHLFSADSYSDLVKSTGFKVLVRGSMEYKMPMEYLVAKNG